MFSQFIIFLLICLGDLKTCKGGANNVTHFHVSLKASAVTTRAHSHCINYVYGIFLR